MNSIFYVIYGLYVIWECKYEFAENHILHYDLLRWGAVCGATLFIYHFWNLVFNGFIAVCVYRHTMLTDLQEKYHAPLKDWYGLRDRFMFRGVIFGMFGGIAFLVDLFLVGWVPYGIVLMIEYPPQSTWFILSMIVILVNAAALAMEMVIGLFELLCVLIGCKSEKDFMELTDVFPGMYVNLREHKKKEETCCSKMMDFFNEVENLSKHVDERDDYAIIQEKIKELEEHENEEKVGLNSVDKMANSKKNSKKSEGGDGEEDKPAETTDEIKA